MDKIKRDSIFGELFNTDSLHQFIRYSAVGISSFLLEFAIFYFLAQVIGLWFILAHILVYSFIFAFNFMLNRIWSFRSKVNLKRQILKYAMLFFFNLLASSAVLFLLSDAGGLDPLISKIIVMCAIVPWNFIMYKKVIYR